jgi:uroporphyrinogen III methyltransferase/synthase
MNRLTAGVAIACIGPITAQTAAEQGLPATVVASVNTIPALAEAIVRHSGRLLEPVR